MILIIFIIIVFILLYLIVKSLKSVPIDVICDPNKFSCSKHGKLIKINPVEMKPQTIPYHTIKTQNGLDFFENKKKINTILKLKSSSEEWGTINHFNGKNIFIVDKILFVYDLNLILVKTFELNILEIKSIQEVVFIRTESSLIVLDEFLTITNTIPIINSFEISQNENKAIIVLIDNSFFISLCE
jgi:hypothetical protein